MKNADKPAYPITLDESIGQTFDGMADHDDLTKRERFAMANWTEDELIQMARVITNEINSGDIKFEDYVNAEDPKVLAKARVRLADALLEELERKPE